MNAEVQSRYEALEKRCTKLTDRVLALTPQQQQSHPDPKAFSPAEILEHFALTEHYDLVFLQKTPPSTLAGKKPVTRFGYKMTVDAMKKASSTTGTLPVMTPKGHVNPQASASKWEGVRESIAKYLAQVTNTEDAFCKMLWFFGTLSTIDFLDMLEAHMHYHETRFPKV